MISMEDAQLETLKREFQESTARIWQDPSIPPHQKPARVERLWREFDARRSELRETMARGELPAGTSRHPVSPITGNPMIFPRKRRRPWK